MTQLLLSLGSLTLGGSAAIVLLALAGHLTRSRYAARWRCWVWLLLCLRLAVPLTLPQRAQAPIQVEVPPAFVQAPVPTHTDGPSVQKLPAQSAPDASGRPAEPAAPQEPERAAIFSFSPAQALAGVWLLGVAGVLGWSLLSHIRFLRYLRRWSTPVEEGELLCRYRDLGLRAGIRGSLPRLLRCRGLRVPMLAGLLFPAVLLPWEELEDQQLDCALLHELLHFRRRDIWLKALCLWVRALYWFNPLCYLMTGLAHRDMELACDEAALGCLTPEEYGVYGKAILSGAKQISSPPSPSAPPGGAH